MSETRVLLANIDEPDLHTIDVYERLGGYGSLRKALLEMTPETVLSRARGVGPARPRRRRLLDGQEGELPPQGRDGQVPVLQRRRVGARRVQGPPADAEEPAPAGGGLHHRLDRRGREQGLHLHPRRVRASGRHPRRSRGRGLREGLPRRGHPRLRALVRPGGAPRPGRVHLRRGDRTARRARGQARQPAPEAALPGEPGPLPGPDADQQRRDALQHADHHRARRRLVQAVRRGQLDRHEAGLGVGQRPAPRATTRSNSGYRSARSSTDSPAARPRGARSSASSPAGRRRPCSRRSTSTFRSPTRRWPRPARCWARRR